MRFLLVLSSFAVFAAECYATGSFWEVKNNASHSASINCVGYGSNEFFAVKNLPPQEGYSFQYDDSYGDSLGYPPPNTWFSCVITKRNKTAVLNFSTLGWGDVNEFVITDTMATVRQRSSFDENLVSEVFENQKS